MASVVSFEERMRADSELRHIQASLFFSGDGLVHETLRRVPALLEASGIDYAITGDLAMFVHGFRQHIDRIAIIVHDAEVLRPLCEEGHLVRDAVGVYRDVRSGVAIDFLFAGNRTYQGHLLTIAIPAPSSVALNIGGRCYASLESLIDLKLALGQRKLDPYAGPDTYSLIRACRLSRGFAEKLNPAIREDYCRTWDLARVAQPRMALPWTKAKVSDQIENLGQLAATLGTEFPELLQMHAAGIELDPVLSRENGCPFLYTNDWFIGDQFEMHPEDEYDFDLLKRQQLIAS